MTVNRTHMQLFVHAKCVLDMPDWDNIIYYVYSGDNEIIQ